MCSIFMIVPPERKECISLSRFRSTNRDNAESLLVVYHNFAHLTGRSYFMNQKKRFYDISRYR